MRCRRVVSWVIIGHSGRFDHEERKRESEGEREREMNSERKERMEMEKERVEERGMKEKRGREGEREIPPVLVLCTPGTLVLG